MRTSATRVEGGLALGWGAAGDGISQVAPEFGWLHQQAASQRPLLV
jgi:hypothetical protein